MNYFLRCSLKFIFPTLILLSHCATTPVSERKQLNFIPDGQMNSLGGEAFQQILAKEKISTDKRLHEIVTRIGKRIAAASGVNFDWQYTVIEDDKTVNAFCLPGGKIAVYTGILPIAQNEAGLAAIMGHEVAHATAKHGAERMSQTVLLQTGLGATDALLGNSKNRGLVVAALGAGAQFGVLLPFSRSHESEADRIGLHYMARAGYDPRAAAELWKRMAAASGGKGPPEWLSTHPSNETRINNLTKLVEEVKGEYEASEKQPDAKI